MSTRKPRLVIVVQSKITGDSRVQKAALSAARAGWEVALLGFDGIGGEPRSWLGPVRVIRRGIGTAHRDAYAARWLEIREPLFPGAYRHWSERANAGRRLSRRIRRERNQLPQDGGITAILRRSLLEARLVAPRLTHKVRSWGAGSHHSALPVKAADEVTWREDLPAFLDWRDAFAPALVTLAPDLIHSNDPAMIGVAHEAVSALRARGHAVGWIHDLHEHVSAVDWGSERITAAYVDHEREYIQAPDALVTVSPEIALMLADEYGLDEPPAVVRNAPLADVSVEDAPSLRERIGLAAGVPLIVSSGSVDPRRGLHTVVEALATLPDVHLAIVTREPETSAGPLRDLLKSAAALGVRGRVHTAPYVPTFQISAYLSSADIGVFAGIHYPNYEASLPTKLTEYLHGGLPLLVSDLATPSAFVREHGVGEVFIAEDAADLSRAVSALLADLATYRAAITGPLLEELSWQHQATTLLDLYTSVSGIEPEAPTDPTPWEVSESDTGALDPWPALEPVHDPQPASETVDDPDPDADEIDADDEVDALRHPEGAQPRLEAVEDRG
ncbi:glycosyltransferase family 4 protein [Occultella gossypii]|uniref:Glycosyltransferase family 4 protein n=1 Tax=Occultella gossypii TaxID=2800820 RepID=A0ABS7S880_9MICO|nr:glycosyltransferase family 4 protein [Occultella gossypii]MBZ2196445.1 glycosyltransferase family 4 protein [Occultella gossypii]